MDRRIRIHHDHVSVSCQRTITLSTTLASRHTEAQNLGASCRYLRRRRGGNRDGVRASPTPKVVTTTREFSRSISVTSCAAIVSRARPKVPPRVGSFCRQLYVHVHGLERFALHQHRSCSVRHSMKFATLLADDPPMVGSRRSIFTALNRLPKRLGAEGA